MQIRLDLEVDSADIEDHLDYLSALSAQCNHITEFGVRNCVSTWAFCRGLLEGTTLVGVDIEQPPILNLEIVKLGCEQKNIDFQFRLGDTLKIHIDKTDLLFIDTEHTFKQLSKELKRHADKVSKYIVMHDTESCLEELWPAIEEFLKKNKEWMLKSHNMSCNGLTTLQRV